MMPDDGQLSQVLRLPAGDPNYAGGLQRLSDEELRAAWDRETRKSGLRQIMQEIKRRERAREATA